MKDLHNLPTAHKRLKAIKKQIENEEIKKTLNRFTYRYRIARAFVGINAPDIGDRTVRGYAAGMKLLRIQCIRRNTFGTYCISKITP